jgi:hypothetical protein
MADKFIGLQDAVDALRKYVETQNEQDKASITSILTPNVSSEERSADKDVKELILNVSRGSKFAKHIKTAVDESKAYKELVKVYVQDDKDTTVGKLLNDADAAKKLAIFEINTARLGCGERLTEAVSLFLNMIPTLEMSRAVPYLAIEVQSNKPPFATKSSDQGMSLMRFLEGGQNRNEASKLLLALQTNVDGNFEEGITNSGMELFTAPQTLVNPSLATKDNETAFIIDKFRPLMSIERFVVDVTGQIGAFSYRVANLDITLHDRSRLSEVADFVSPCQYGNTRLMIEYGWSHPDASGDNAFAMLINAMKIREKYRVVNSSFSFTQSGEVKIKLHLATEGVFQTKYVSIGDDDEAVMNSRRAVEKLQTLILEIRSSMQDSTTNGGAKTIKEIRPEQTLFSQHEDIGRAFLLDDATAKEIKEFINKYKKSETTPRAKELAEALSDFYGKDGTGKSGEIKNLKDNIGSVIHKKLADLKEAKNDAFLSEGLTSINKQLEKAEEKEKNKKPLDMNSYVSLGRLLSIFVGKPMCAQGFEEVQFFFYPFNPQAGACACINIASFPIKYEELETGFKAFGVNNGLALTIEQFVKYISNNFIEDMGNRAYGLSRKYSTEIDAKTGLRKVKEAIETDKVSKKRVKGDQEKIDKEAAQDSQTRLIRMGAIDGTYVQPQVECIIEALPLDTAAYGESASTVSKKTILRIMFFDSRTPAYGSVGEMVRKSREHSLDEIAPLNAKDDNKNLKEYLKSANDVIKTAKDFGVIKDGVLAFDIGRLRAFMRRNVPSIVYGSNNTNVREANFATMQDPQLSSIHMRKMLGDGSSSPSGLAQSNLPLTVMPATISMIMAGCPLVHFMQQFYVDFNTNTTADNIYAITKLSHEISSGKFETRADMVPYDGWGRYTTYATQVSSLIRKLDTISIIKK